jgi:hypothetical protein
MSQGETAFAQILNVQPVRCVDYRPAHSLEGAPRPGAVRGGRQGDRGWRMCNEGGLGSLCPIPELSVSLYTAHPGKAKHERAFLHRDRPRRLGRDVLAARGAQLAASREAERPPLLELSDGCRSATERTAAGPLRPTTELIKRNL